MNSNLKNQFFDILRCLNIQTLMYVVENYNIESLLVLLDKYQEHKICHDLCFYFSGGEANMLIDEKFIPSITFGREVLLKEKTCSVEFLDAISDKLTNIDWEAISCVQKLDDWFIDKYFSDSSPT